MNPFHVSGAARPPGGQWINQRSSWSTPSASRLAAIVSRSRPALPEGSLVVTKTSSRGTPLSRSARPTSRSLPYMVAVSMWR
jgi:hypothetical protein